MIKPGYQLHIITWENDGDNYKTEILNGLTEADVRFYVHIVKRFNSRNAHTNPGLGNSYNKVEVLTGLAAEALAANPGVSDEIRDAWNYYLEGEYPEDIIELYTELLGTPDEYYFNEYGFCRVCEAFKVFYIPKSIEEVTKRFK